MAWEWCNVSSSSNSKATYRHLSHCMMLALLVLQVVMLPSVHTLPQGYPRAQLPSDPFAPPPLNNPPPPPPPNYVSDPFQQPLPNFNQMPPQPNFNQMAPPPNFNMMPPPNNMAMPPPNLNMAMPPPNANFQGFAQSPPVTNTQMNNGFGGFPSASLQSGWNPTSNMIGQMPMHLPSTRPMHTKSDLSQPMPPEAASASYSPPPSSGSTEQEYESNGGSGGGGGGGGWVDHQPVSLGNGYYGPQSSSLLEAYYGPGSGRAPAAAAPRRNDIFGGLFGGSPGANLIGAMMMNEIVF